MEYQQKINVGFWNLHDFIDFDLHLEESMLNCMEFEEVI